MTQQIAQSDPPSDQRAATVWIISDGAAGNERQALALAGAMGLTAKILRVALRAPWSWASPRLHWGARMALGSALRREFSPPWPVLAIGCGRQAALLIRALRTWSGGRTYTVQILDPRIATEHFDLVIAPRHDAVSGTNVIQTIGALNPVDDAWLERAAAEFSTLQQLPHPRTALLIGGPRRGLNLDARWLDQLIEKLRSSLKAGGSLLITSSRRTPPAWRARLRGALDNGCAYFWDGSQDGANPYAGYLAAADRIVVTPDSVNMLSEACASGKPVYSFLPANAHGKLRALHAELHAQGWLRNTDLDSTDLDSTAPDRLRPALPPPLRELAAVASKVWHDIESRRPDIGAALGDATAI